MERKVGQEVVRTVITAEAAYFQAWVFENDCDVEDPERIKDAVYFYFSLAWPISTVEALATHLPKGTSVHPFGLIRNGENNDACTTGMTIFLGKNGKTLTERMGELFKTLESVLKSKITLKQHLETWVFKQDNGKLILSQKEAPKLGP